MFDIDKNRIPKKIRKILSKKNLSTDDCALIIVHLGELTEIRKEQPQFPKITLYRNLLVHPELDRPPISIFLLKLEEQFAIPESRKSTSDFIAEFFSAKTLQTEIVSLTSLIPELEIFKGKKIWVDFFGCILESLLDKPLLSKDLSNQIVSMFLKALPDESGLRKPHWVIEVRKGVKIVCKFCLDYPPVP